MYGGGLSDKKLHVYPLFGDLTQWFRVSALQAESHWFKSINPHKYRRVEQLVSSSGS